MAHETLAAVPGPGWLPGPCAARHRPSGLPGAGPGWRAPGSPPWKILGAERTSGILRQHGVEAAQWGELQCEAEWVDADADEGHNAGVL